MNKLVKSAIAGAVITATCMSSVIPAFAETKGESNVVCNVGSVSKTVVTAAVLQMVEQGQVDLDEPVVTYIPEFKMSDERYRDITVRMLMNHSSGLMGTTYEDSFLLEDIDVQSSAKLLKNLENRRLKADPGEYATYCNDGFWLLEILVERVSGESFTDYVANHISSPLGLTQMGTSVDMFGDENLIDIFVSGNRMGHEYCMDLGSGGVIASAEDLCKYGSGYYMGNESLISDTSKAEMFKSYAQDEYELSYGLGWDTTEDEEFEASGVKVVEKGGSTSQQFSSLYVAPDESISVAVLSSGSGYMGSSFAARNLMKAALLEKGIEIADKEIEEVAVTDNVPADCIEYEGYYTSGSDIFKIEFPEKRYMKMTECEVDNPKTFDYKPTVDGRFVRMDGDVERNIQDADQQILEFEKRADGGSYIVGEENTNYQNLGVYSEKGYYAQKLEAINISQSELEAAKQFEGKYGMYSGKYSNMLFSNTTAELRLSKECPGYLIDVSGQTCLTRLVNGSNAQAFVKLPGEKGRDMTDLEISVEADKKILIAKDKAITYISEDSMKEFSTDFKSVSTTQNQACWYKLTDQTAGRTLNFDRPNNTSIYVLDKFGNIVYSSYMLDWPSTVALPSDGYIVFAGDTGQTIELSFSQK